MKGYTDQLLYNPFDDPSPSPLWKRVELLPGGSCLIPRGWWHNVYSAAGAPGCPNLVPRLVPPNSSPMQTDPIPPRGHLPSFARYSNHYSNHYSNQGQSVYPWK